MIKKILMVLIPVVAFLGGAAAGDFLRPAGDSAAAPADHDAKAGDGDHGAPAAKTDHAPAKAKPAGGHGDAPAKSADHAAKSAGHGAKGGGGDPSAPTWFTFPQQFFVPVMRNGRLDSTMVLSLSVELPADAAEAVYAQEIPLRDLMLRQLLITANTGGFDGNFTAEPHLRALRDDLLTAAQTTEPRISAVLIGDIARQDAR